jgi:hypothetical protein
MAFKKAVKSQAKLRAALFGPSGAGKTYSALAIASGMGSKIALIDSERGSASKYADRFNFDADDLVNKTIEEYVQKIHDAGAAGYDVLIIDSLSHAWQELLEEIDKLANAKYKGNTWSAWSEGTPKQHHLVDAILSFPGHVLATMRSKTEWQTEQGNNGKSRPVRVGLAPEQGKGIEYEFDLLLEISTDHIANVIKDRTGKFQDKLIDKPGKEFGEQMVAWLSEGAPAAPFRAPSATAGTPTGNQGGATNTPAGVVTEARLEKMKALSDELVVIMGSTVGTVPAFNETAKAEARTQRQAISIKRASDDDYDALVAMVRDYRAKLDSLRMAWEAAGSPIPRPEKLVPKDEPEPEADSHEQPAASSGPDPEAPAPERPVAQKADKVEESPVLSASGLSPAAQAVAKAAGVTFPAVEPKPEPKPKAPEPVLAGTGEEEYGLF